MADALDILNPNNPLLDSEEEDDDFEPEEPVTNDGLFVKTRSGKGGVDDSVTELGDVDASLKRNAQMAFEELQREEEKSLDTIRKKQRLVYGFSNLSTTEEDGMKYFDTLLHSENSAPKQIDMDELGRSIESAIKELNQSKSKTAKTRVVKFAGEKIKLEDKANSAGTLDTLVQSLEAKKSISTIDKSSYDWDKFKDAEGIKEEVENAKKDGYIDKQEFLHRVDYRIFEKERDQRELERIRQEAERRQNRR